MRIGIVLSGGGIRGIAHLGILKALKDKGVKISNITGTSAGAIAGALFANDIDPYDALQFFNETRLIKHLRPAFAGPALLNLETTFSILKDYLPHNSFENLKIPITITATNLNDGKLVYFSQGELIRKILASSCIPGIFRPIEIEGKLYVDGGVLNNFPVEPLLENCDVIIGSSCNHLPATNRLRSIKHVMERTALLSVNRTLEEKCKLVDVLIEPHGLGETGIFDVKKSEQIFWVAYQETLNKIDEIRNVIEKAETKMASVK